MKSILTSIAAGALLAAFAIAQQLPDSEAADHAVYVVTGYQQFGIVDLKTGAFHQISGTPEPDANLVYGPDGKLYSVGAASGSLVSIDSVSGTTTVIGPTGLGPNVFAFAGAAGKLYSTDFNNNLYSVNPATGAATLIGPTGIPPDPSVPFTFNADGTFNLCDETLYGIGDKLYASFDSFTLDPSTLTVKVKVPAKLWRIDPETGVATLIAPTSLNLGASVYADGRFYAFHLVPVGFSAAGPQTINQLDTLDLTNGLIRFISDIDPAAGPIFGAAPVRGQNQFRPRLEE
jgi:hypothetical protein